MISMVKQKRSFAACHYLPTSGKLCHIGHLVITKIWKCPFCWLLFQPSRNEVRAEARKSVSKFLLTRTIRTSIFNLAHTAQVWLGPGWLSSNPFWKQCPYFLVDHFKQCEDSSMLNVGLRSCPQLTTDQVKRQFFNLFRSKRAFPESWARPTFEVTPRPRTSEVTGSRPVKVPRTARQGPEVWLGFEVRRWRRWEGPVVRRGDKQASGVSGIGSS